MRIVDRRGLCRKSRPTASATPGAAGSSPRASVTSARRARQASASSVTNDHSSSTSSASRRSSSGRRSRVAAATAIAGTDGVSAGVGWDVDAVTGRQHARATSGGRRPPSEASSRGGAGVPSTPGRPGRAARRACSGRPRPRHRIRPRRRDAGSGLHAALADPLEVGDAVEDRRGTDREDLRQGSGGSIGRRWAGDGRGSITVDVAAARNTR